MKHILRLIIAPETRPPSLQTLGAVDVATLETVAENSLSSWFQKPGNEEKRVILQQLFEVARMEEEYVRDKIGQLL